MNHQWVQILSPSPTTLTPIPLGCPRAPALSALLHALDLDPSFILHMVQFSSVQSLSLVPLFVNPWIAARQASLSITNSQSWLKLMPIESVMPSSHLILCRPLLLLPQTCPESGSFPMSQFFAWGGQSIGVSASAPVLPMNTQDWSL